MDVKTTVKTAEGKVISYEGAVEKFIVAHPKSAFFAALAVGLVLGWLLHAVF